MGNPSQSGVPLTQAVIAGGGGGKSAFTYFWVVIFIHDENKEDPFGIFTLSTFQGMDFPFQYIKGSLSCDNRAATFSLKQFSNQEISVFAKIEKGINT